MVLLPGENDLAYLKTVNKEAHVLFFPELKLFKRLFVNEEHDQLYGESKTSDYEIEPLLIPAFVDFTIDQSKLLTIFGKDEKWDLIIWCSVEVMNDMEISVELGDVFVVDEEEYTVMEKSLESHVINQSLFLERAFATERRRGDSLRDNRVDFDADGPNLEEGQLGEEPIVYDSLYPED